jgi:hypothetical protein
MFYFFSLFVKILFALLEFLCTFFTHEVIVPYQSSAQIPCREKVGVAFVALSILGPQIERHFDQPQSRAI